MNSLATETQKHSLNFVQYCFWWPEMASDVYKNSSLSDACQCTRRISWYIPLSGAQLRRLLSTFSTDFAGLIRISVDVHRHMLVWVIHLTARPVARAEHDTTSLTGLNFIENETIRLFGPKHTILGEKGRFFTATALVEFLEKYGIKWCTVMTFEKVSNWRAEMEVRKCITSVYKVVRYGEDWENALNQYVFGYRRRRRPSGVSPFELL